MVTICLQCGDVGFSNAYVYCVNCLKFAIHRYCLPEIPKTLDEFVHWVCDDCEAVSLGSSCQKAILDTQDDRCTERVRFTATSGSNKSSIAQSSPVEDENFGRTGSMPQAVHEYLCSSADARLADDHCLSGVEPNANNGWSRNEKVPMKLGHQSDTCQQLDEAEEVKVAVDDQRTNLGKKAEVSSSLSRKERYEGHSSRKTNEARKHMRDSVREREKAHTKKESLVIPSRSYVNEEVLRETHEARRPMHNTVREEYKELANKESIVNPTRSNVREDVSHTTHKARRHMHSNICEKYEDRVEKELVIPTRSEVVSRSPIITPPIARPSCCSLQVQPVVDPIWRGKFDIVNQKGKKFEGFVAHLSNRACQLVVEEARLLPALLQLEMVPKSTVWPKSFQAAEPSDDSIALYIFPADTSYEKKFACLVDDMSRDGLAMRTTTKNAELLIFSSTELQMQYWRFQNKYYIWGVFKGKR